MLQTSRCALRKSCQSFDQLANQLAIGDFYGDGRKELAVGAYLYDEGAETDAGAVQVIYQSELIFANGFE